MASITDDEKLARRLRRCNILNGIARYNTYRHQILDMNMYAGGKGMDSFRKRLFNGIMKYHKTSYGPFIILEYWGANGPDYELFDCIIIGSKERAIELCKAFQERMIPIIRQRLIDEMA